MEQILIFKCMKIRAFWQPKQYFGLAKIPLNNCMKVDRHGIIISRESAWHHRGGPLLPGRSGWQGNIYFIWPPRKFPSCCFPHVWRTARRTKSMMESSSKNVECLLFLDQEKFCHLCITKFVFIYFLNCSSPVRALAITISYTHKLLSTGCLQKYWLF